MRLSLLSILCVLLCAGSLRADEPTADDNARFLAGLPVRDTALANRAHLNAWVDHATALDQAWTTLQRRQLTPIGQWSSEFIGAEQALRPLLYLFSGPDFLYAQAFFPNAPTYVLCGIEPVGNLPAISEMPPEVLGPSLQMLRQSLDSVLNWSFFITKNMRVEFEQNRLKGTVPVLYLFLARTGCHLEDARLVRLDHDGNLSEAATEGVKGTPGVQITFTRSAGSKAQTLYYFASDLSDGPADKSGFLKWCRTLGPANSFLKSASYLLHTGGFDTARKFLLEQSETILEDDSGIPMNYFDPGRWSVRLFGAYPGPIELFKQHRQPQLADLYRVSNAPSLKFGFGYRWHASESTLILATKKGSQP